MEIDRILQFIRSKGPVLPVQVASELKQNLIIAGAVLSEIAKSGKIKISNTKVGGSPVYYVPEHEYRLQDLYKHLNEKDKRAYDLLKQQKVLRDTSLTPLLRVSLRNIKDFAKPIEVQTSQGTEIFWRWYMTSMQEAEGSIKGFFQQRKPDEPQEKPAEPKEPQAAEPVQPKAAENQPEADDQSETKNHEPREEEPREKSEPKESKNLEGYEKTDNEEIQDSLHEKTKRFFKSKDIKVLDVDIIRKNAEIDYTVDVPTPLGQIQYYCKAKTKKKNTEGDIAQVFVKGQGKKLPVLYISTGDLTKKAREAIGKVYKNLIFKKLG